MNRFRKLRKLLSVVLFFVTVNVHSATDDRGKPAQVAEEFYSVYMDYYFRMVMSDQTMMNKYVTTRFNREIKQTKICKSGYDPVWY